MSVFDIAYRRLLQLEEYPGYSHNPKDTGGETVAGISRRWWPGWDGWDIVDRLSVFPNFPRNLAESQDLAELVREFYLTHYWSSTISLLSNQALATWMFQMAVNVGERQMVMMVQRALGVPADGILGPITMGILEVANQSNVLTVARDKAIAHYKGIVAKNPSQECFLSGWINRANA